MLSCLLCVQEYIVEERARASPLCNTLGVVWGGHAHWCAILQCIYRYEKAAFCLEELVLSNPHHHLYHQRYAEVGVQPPTLLYLSVPSLTGVLLTEDSGSSGDR